MCMETTPRSAALGGGLGGSQSLAHQRGFAVAHHHDAGQLRDHRRLAQATRLEEALNVIDSRLEIVS